MVTTHNLRGRTLELEDTITLWQNNAEAWTQMSRMGYDINRDWLNLPNFLKILPPVAGLKGLDVGCGEGTNTRAVAQRGAKMIGIDVSSIFIEHAAAHESTAELGIEYLVASATELPFSADEFDFVMSTMCLMDIPDLEKAIADIYRVLRKGGFLQFSIMHPCFSSPAFKWVHNDDGERIAVESGRYFEEKVSIDEWTFTAAPPEISSQFEPFRVAHFHRTLTSWISLLLATGFSLEALNEPTADDEVIAKYPALAYARSLPLFLQMRFGK
jgi:Methylase involved in ubiquinone/menaquinone biosynthesis